MPKRHSALWSVLAWPLLLVSTVAFAQPNTKKKATSQADLPRFTYPVQGSASELVQADDGTFNAFAGKVQADLDNILSDYEIEDKSTMRRLFEARLNLQELAGKYQAALETVDALHTLQEKPAANFT